MKNLKTCKDCKKCKIAYNTCRCEFFKGFVNSYDKTCPEFEERDTNVKK